ncbi:MAG: hypothetical protein R3A13_05625 [Bdellovibrionota bacterium]
MEAALCIWTSSTLSSRLKDLTSLRVQNSCLFFTAEFSFVNLQNNEVPKKFRLFLNGEELAFEERVEPIITDDIDSKFSRDPNTHRATHSLAIEVNPGDRLEILSLMNDKLADRVLSFSKRESCSSNIA